MAQYKGAASEAGRAMQLRKKREKEREQLEQLKLRIAEVSTMSNVYFTLMWLYYADALRNEGNSTRGAARPRDAGPIHSRGGRCSRSTHGSRCIVYIYVV